MSDRLLQETKRTIKLGKIEYQLSPITLNVLASIEEEFGCNIGALQEQFNQKQATTLRGLAWVMLKDKNPKLTKEDIGAQINLKNLQEVAEKLFSVIKESIEE